MIRIVLAASGLLASPALAQQSVDPHAGHVMPEPAPPTDADDATGPVSTDPHAAHGPVEPSVAPAMAPDVAPVGTVPAPSPPTDFAADAIFGVEAMAKARAVLFSEVGDVPISTIRFDLAEVQVRNGSSGYRWEGEAWYGNGIHRAQLNYEGEGGFGEPLEQVEFQLLYSRAIAPYFNAEIGVRYDIRPDPSRAYIVVGVEGLAPYWFELSGQLFLSDKGDVSARVEASYDLRVTQRIIIQPRVEVNANAQDVAELGIGSGISYIEAGVRLRYEIAPNLAPYIGYEFAASLGDTADFVRGAGRDPSSGSFVAGIKFWF